MRAPTRRHLLAVLLLVPTLALVAAPPSGTAPSPRVTISAGVKVTTDGVRWCSLGPVGHDRADRAVALLAGHCMDRLGDPLFLCADQTQGATACGRAAEPGVIGSYATVSSGFDAEAGEIVDWNIDYSVVALDPAVTALDAVTPNGLVVERIGEWPALGRDIACKDGRRTGKTCGLTLSLDRNVIGTWGAAWFGDSGSPLLVGTGVVAITSTIDPNPAGPFSYVGLAGILEDLEARGGDPVGAGFVPVPPR
ncbi:hypothetical protein SAMN05444695_10185 [Rhodococcus triatomae]|uniref:Trypsin-like peptidase domain-containing protein n=1 Tax=Rhodococcus triatomae TaxID=300028 RepID=A0A1G7ZEL3_9NOCA|nr:hypothetical protein SAMN05444695_10185 [Rhodococcus triatomae]